MASERSTSIHDLRSAPAAPGASSLADISVSSSSTNNHQRNSPKGSRKRRKSLPPLLIGDIFPPDLPAYAERKASPLRMRSDTAPGRLGNIREMEDDSPEDMPSNSIVSYNRLSSSNSMWNEYDDDDEVHPYRIPPNPGHTSSQRRFCGIQVPNMARVSSFLARRAPCFWICGSYLGVGATDRSILYRLNLLCAFFAILEVAATSFLVTVLFSDSLVDRNSDFVDREETEQTISLNFWNLNATVFFLGLLAAIILITVLYTLKIVREVNLIGSVRYLWVLAWLLPLQIFFVLSLIDYHRVTAVWVKHWWSLPTMAWFRRLFCAEGTANRECIIPVQGGLEFDDITWCTVFFDGATNCTAIRDEAQSKMLKFSYIFYFSLAIWGSFLAALMVLTINMLEGIITKPIVQAARESNFPTWMLLPTVGCLGTGSVFIFSPSTAISGDNEATNSQWVGVLYIICGGCFFISALFGWFIGTFSILNARDKRNKNLAVICFISINVIIVGMLGAVFVGSILVSTNLVDVPLTDTERGRAACDIDTAQSCTLCGNRIGQPECPEWTEKEVIKILQTQFKQSATLAVIFVLYAISALRFGILLRRHISMYQIDYV